MGASGAGKLKMVNTRILEQQLGWRRGRGPEGAEAAPRGLAHEPMLQGRLRGGGGGAPIAAGQAVPRRRLSRATQADTWAAIEAIGETLDAAAARRGAIPPVGPGSAAGEMLDQLRGALLRAIGAQGWRRIGITAPHRGAGASFLAIGLAASLARLDYLHLVLVDLDLGHPGLAAHLGLTPRAPLEEVLRGNLAPLAQMLRAGDRLALALNEQPVRAAADLLHSPEATLALRALDAALAPDLILFDLPPLLSDPAAQAALAQVDAVLLVADGTRTTARDITEAERVLNGQVPLLGVVLNKSEDRPPPASAA